MRYSGRTERDEEGPWFQLGQLEVTTTVGVLLIWGLTLVIWAAEGPTRSVTGHLMLSTDDVATGEVWRLFTWPFTHGIDFSLWDIINAAIFWWFASDLERQIGRRSFAALLVATTVLIGLSATLIGTLFDHPTVISDFGLLTLAVILLYIAEHPMRPFFFGIPAWVIGAVIALIEVVNDVNAREWTRLGAVLLSSGFIALAAKRAGLLSMYDQIPEVGLPGREARAQRKAERQREKERAKRSTAGSGGGGLGARFGRGKEAEIVEMPTQATRPRPRPMPAVPDDLSADDIALDALLDKISATGIDSLTADERRQLDEIRERRHHD